MATVHDKSDNNIVTLSHLSVALTKAVRSGMEGRDSIMGGGRGH